MQLPRLHGTGWNGKMTFFRLYLWFLWLLIKGATDDVLVLVGLKWYPPSGPPRWKR